jgi:hypothetical protein
VGRKERDRALGEPEHRGGLLVAMQLGVDQAAVVVDRAVGDLIADPLALLSACPEAVARDRMPGEEKRAKRLVSF